MMPVKITPHSAIGVTITAARATIGGVRPPVIRRRAGPASCQARATRPGRKAPREGGLPRGSHPLPVAWWVAGRPRTDPPPPWPFSLAGLERRLGARGCRKVNLLIEPGNKPVTGFYRRRGYAEDRLIFMEKWLPPGTGREPASPDGVA
jgi:hypothetical protein